MKRTYGSWWARKLRGGVTLSNAEYKILEKVIDALPNQLRETVQRQFEMYDLVQREIDGRALNFYRMSRTPPIFPLLTMARDESPLVKITVTLNDDFGLVHGTLTAVNGRAFCLSFSKRIDGVQDTEAMLVLEVTQA